MSDKSITVLMPEWMRDEIATLAQNRERSIGAEVRLAIQAHLRSAKRETK